MTLQRTHTEPPPPDEPPFDPDYDAIPAAERFDAHRPPQDIEAEQTLLGALLTYPEKAQHAATLLDPTDFYFPKHETLWKAVQAVTETGALAEPSLVLDHLRRTGNLKPTHLDGPYLANCMEKGQHGQIDDNARVILEAAQLRAALEGANKIIHAIKSGRRDNVAETLGHVVDALDVTAGRFGATSTVHTHRIETIDELLDGEDDDTYDWVIPGLIEHQERVILTAEEGAGKSTLLRQIGIQAAAGMHPFTGDPIPPVTVLHIDVENTRRQSRRRYRPLRIQAGTRLEPDRLRIELRTAGIDLTTTTDRDWLLATCKHVQPDLILIGPIYKLANGDPTEEKSAKPVAMALDAVRDQTDAAVILEAHAPKAPTGQKRRPHEPYGWSGWLRWPEVGLWLDTGGELTPWRGAREERSWPEKLDRGGDWPWSPAITEIAGHWNDIRIARQNHGAPMSYRQVADAIGKSKSFVERLVSPNAPYGYAWRLLNKAVDRADDTPLEDPK